MAEFAIRRIDELDPELVTVTVNPESERLRFQINSLDLNKTIDNPNYELECEDPKKMLQTKTVWLSFNPMNLELAMETDSQIIYRSTVQWSV